MGDGSRRVLCLNKGLQWGELPTGRGWKEEVLLLPGLGPTCQVGGSHLSIGITPKLSLSLGNSLKECVKSYPSKPSSYGADPTSAARP